MPNPNSPIRPAVPRFSSGKLLSGKERRGPKRRKSAVVPTKSILTAAWGRPIKGDRIGIVAETGELSVGVIRDPGCPEAVTAERSCDAGRRGPPADHRIGVRLRQSGIAPAPAPSPERMSGSQQTLPADPR
jgi:hypothetical protein